MFVQLGFTVKATETNFVSAISRISLLYSHPDLFTPFFDRAARCNRSKAFCSGKVQNLDILRWIPYTIFRFSIYEQMNPDL